MSFASQSRALEMLREQGNIEIVLRLDDGTWSVRLADGRGFTVYRNGVCREVIR